MSVRQIAPALLAASDLFVAVNNFVNGDDATVSLDVSASKTGSIEVELQLAQQQALPLFAFFASDPVTALVNARMLVQIVFGDLGLISFFKRTQGQPVERGELPRDDVAPPRDGQVRMAIEGGSADVADLVRRLAEQAAMQPPLDRLIRTPLESEGITEFRSTYNGHVEKVGRDEADYFGLRDQVVSQNRLEQWFTVVSVSFKESRKWYLDDGGTTIPVTIGDEEFLESVQAGEKSFSNGDRLFCIVHIKKTYGRRG